MSRTSSAPSGTRLKSGTLGLISLATFGAVMMSPALGLYGQFGPMASLVGDTTPLVYLAALLVSLPTAISYSLLNRALPSAGSAFTWVWVALSPTLGTWVGLMMIAYYTVALIMPPILFGLFFADLLSFLGVVEANLVSWTGGVILVTVFVAWLTYRGIELSTRSSLVFVLIEIAVVLALSATIFSVKIMQGEFSFAPLNPAHTTGGFSAFWQAMVLGVLSYAGYDVISTVAEEAKAPRRLLPKATLLATVGVGLFWALNAWAFSLSLPVSRVAELTASGLSAAVPIGREFWGQGELLVILTGLTAAVGVYVATAVGASRAVYAMARKGLLPSVLSALNPRFQVPWNAMHLVYFSSLAGALLVTAILGNAVESFVWWAGAVVFFALITYMGTNAANLLYFSRSPAQRFNPLLNGVLPVVGVVLDAYLIYRCFFKELWSAGFRTGQSIILCSLLLVLLSWLYLVYLRLHRPQHLADVEKYNE